MKLSQCAEFTVRECLLLACSVLALALALLLPDGKSFAAQGFNWYVQAGMHNLLAPRLAYAAFLVALLASAFFSFRLGKKWASLVENRSARLALLPSLIIVILVLASAFTYFRSLFVAAATACICVVLFFVWRNLPSKLTGIFSLLLAAVVFLAAVLPGLLEVPDLSRHSPESIASIESHQALSTAAEQRLAQGCKLFEAVGARYGVLWQSLLAAYTKFVNPLTVGDSIMFTRWLHTLFFAAAAFAYWKFSRRAVFAACLAVLFIAPWMELKQNLFWFPQVTSWRYFGFALAPVLLVILENSNGRLRALLLGVASAVALLSDLASGVSVTLGLIAYLAFRRDSCAIGRLLFLFGAGFFGALIAFFSIFTCAFGYLPSHSAGWAELKRTIWECAGGTAPAIGYPFDPLAIVILLHTAYAALKLSGKGPLALAPRDALRLCLCVISLLWFVHYVNEPNTFALRAARVLYGFLLIDHLRSLAVCLRRKRNCAEPLWILSAFLVAIIIPAAVVSYQPAAEKMANLFKPGSRTEPEKLLVSGVFLSEDVGKALTQKSEYLRNTGGGPLVAYLTVDNSIVPKLSGVVSSLPLADPCGELLFSKQSERFVKAIGESGVRKIYVDDPNFITVQNAGSRSCLAYLRMLLQQYYRLSFTESGWQIWVLKKAG